MELPLTSQILALLGRVRELSDAADADSAPYESKYEARKLLESVSPGSTPLLGISLGILQVQTEEFGRGERTLVTALRSFCDFLGVAHVAAAAAPTETNARNDVAIAPHLIDATDSAAASLSLACSIAIEGCNTLALVYSGWDQYPNSLHALRLALAIYGRATSYGHPHSPASDRRLDEMYTQSLYYMAQIYSSLGEVAAASRFCARTLVRQLPTLRKFVAVQMEDVDQPADQCCSPSEGDAVEWCRNALRLSLYYSSLGVLHTASLCLYAADIVLYRVALNCTSSSTARSNSLLPLPPPPPAPFPGVHLELLPDAIQRLLAESATHWGNVFMMILKAARDRALRRELGEGGGDANAGAAFAAEQGACEYLECDETESAVALPPRWMPLHIRQGSCTNRNVNGATEDPASAHLSQPKPAAAHTSSSSSPPPLTTAYFDAERIDVHAWESDGADGPDSNAVAALSGFIAATAASVPRTWAMYGPQLTTVAVAPAVVNFSSASTTALLRIPNPRAIASFDTARPVFKHALAAYQRAKCYFVLDGFVTEHVAISLGIAKLYKYISHFETIAKRREIMHSRRVSALADLISALNPGLYVHELREMQYEAAEGATAAFETRVGASSGSGSSSGSSRLPPGRVQKDAAAAMAYASSAIYYFTLFQKSYVDPRIVNVPSAPNEGSSCPAPNDCSSCSLAGRGEGSSEGDPVACESPASAAAAMTTAAADAASSEEGGAASSEVGGQQCSTPTTTLLDDASAAAYCTSHLMIARLLLGRACAIADAERSSTRTRMMDLRASLARFKWLMVTAPALAPSDTTGDSDTCAFFAAELEICRDYADIVSMKMRAVLSTASST